MFITYNTPLDGLEDQIVLSNATVIVVSYTAEDRLESHKVVLYRTGYTLVNTFSLLITDKVEVYLDVFVDLSSYGRVVCVDGESAYRGGLDLYVKITGITSNYHRHSEPYFCVSDEGFVEMSRYFRPDYIIIDPVYWVYMPELGYKMVLPCVFERVV